jgi:hypothetical protein
MTQPTPMTRCIGARPVAAVLYLGSGLLVLGWARGEVSWWLAIAALCFAGTVRRAVRDVRSYNRWWTAWQEMGAASAASASSQPATPKPDVRTRKATSAWARVIVATGAALMLPFFVAAAGDSDALRECLTVLWSCVVLYLVYKVAAAMMGAFRRKSGITGSIAKTHGGRVDLVQWVLPRASSSPSRADAMRALPEYSARLMIAE